MTDHDHEMKHGPSVRTPERIELRDTRSTAELFDMSHIPVRGVPAPAPAPGSGRSASMLHDDDDSQPIPVTYGTIHTSLQQNLNRAMEVESRAISSPPVVISRISCWENQHFQWAVMAALIAHLVIAPFVLVLVYYLDAIHIFVPAIFACMISGLFVLLIYRHVKSLNHSWTFKHNKTNEFITIVLHDWRWEWYQAVVTLLGCATYIAYTYQLRFEIDQTNPNQYDYHLEMDVDEFCQCEYFLMVCFAFDYLFRYYSTPLLRRSRFLIDTYNILDMAAFIALVYGSIVARGFEPRHAVYNWYLFQGPFRFLRLRRAVKSLDAPRSSRIGREYRLGPWVISRLSARVVVVAFKSVLYILCAASLILAVEFPCVALVNSVSSTCCTQPCSIPLRQFHNCIYLTVVTLSTVGYGDLTCSTVLGRMLIVVIILLALLIVPRELNSIMEAATAAKLQQEELQQQREKEYMANKLQQQQQPPPQQPQPQPQQPQQQPIQAAADQDVPITQQVPFVTPVGVQITPLQSDAVVQWVELQLYRHRTPAQLHALCNLLEVSPIPKQPQMARTVARALLWPELERSFQSQSQSESVSESQSPSSSSLVSVARVHPHQRLPLGSASELELAESSSTSASSELSRTQSARRRRVMSH